MLLNRSVRFFVSRDTACPAGASYNVRQRNCCSQKCMKWAGGSRACVTTRCYWWEVGHVSCDDDAVGRESAACMQLGWMRRKSTINESVKVGGRDCAIGEPRQGNASRLGCASYHYTTHVVMLPPSHCAARCMQVAPRLDSHFIYSLDSARRILHSSKQRNASYRGRSENGKMQVLLHASESLRSMHAATCITQVCVYVFLFFFMDLRFFNCNKTQISSVDFVINRFFMKMFNTNNIEIVKYRPTGSRSSVSVYHCHFGSPHRNFFGKIRQCENLLVKRLLRM